MRYIEAPQQYAGTQPSVFLAGGISDCDNWQGRMVELLSDTDMVVLNPRRERFPMDDPDAARGQIAWEFEHLRRATLRLFWFPPQTLCPITLFELGAWSGPEMPLLVGVAPEYRRRQDVEIQLSLARPDVRVACSLEDLAAQVRESQWNTAPKEHQR